MKGPEKRYFNEFRATLGWPFIERVENRVNLGTPDTHFISPTKKGWLEFKAEPDLRPNSVVGLSTEQVVWAVSYAEAGGLSWITLRAGKTYFLWDGRLAKSLTEQLLSQTCDLAAIWGEKSVFYERLRFF